MTAAARDAVIESEVFADIVVKRGGHIYLSQSDDAGDVAMIALTLADAARLASLLSDNAGREWEPIESAHLVHTDHMHTILVNWKSRGVCETYWDEDDEFADRPKGWLSPREGWRAPGDQCIPVNQGDATHWRPLPAPPLKTRATEGE